MEDLAIDKFKNDIRFKKKIVHVETIPPRKAKYKNIDLKSEKIKNYLKNKNIKLYKHQAISYKKIKNKENIIITTPTASGKTLAFNIPIIEDLIEDETATALYIYPSKALSNDQLNVLKKMEEDLEADLKPERYDGDTPKNLRHEIRSISRLVITNPYQIHHILSWHHQWERFYSNLKYIVIDESHQYRGIYGSNVALLIRRLKRIFKHYNSNPQFILSSATLANPIELANKLTGEEFSIVCDEDDGSPSGEKDFILYNPYHEANNFKNIDSQDFDSQNKSYINDSENNRYIENPKNNNLTNDSKNNNSVNNPKENYLDKYLKNKPRNNNKVISVNRETERIFNYLIMKNIQTLCFTTSRKNAELIARWSKNDIVNYKRKLKDMITPYRSGYLAKERQEIELGLKNREYLGVTSTNALELGVDIGSLDAVLISGFPGTIISTWQQAGRAGREKQKALVILIAYSNQLDQYYMMNPKFFFDKAHENAIIDLNNEILNIAHSICAAYELPLENEELEYFNIKEDLIETIKINQENNKKYLRSSKNRDADTIIKKEDQYFYNLEDNPSFKFGLHQITSDIFSIVIKNMKSRVLETLERSQAYREAHEGAVVLNKGETYIVEKFNIKTKTIEVVKKNVKFYTHPLKLTNIKIIKTLKTNKIGKFKIHFAELEVTEKYYKYKKIALGEVIGTYIIDLPPIIFKTKGIYFTFEDGIQDKILDFIKTTKIEPKYENQLKEQIKIHLKNHLKSGENLENENKFEFEEKLEKDNKLNEIFKNLLEKEINKKLGKHLIKSGIKDGEDVFNDEDILSGSIHGLEHSLISLYPIHLMCDRNDIGGLSTNYHKDTEKATVFIYDGYEGGIGINEKAINIFDNIISSTKSLIENCSCYIGCPSCIYSPKCGNDNKPLNKDGTLFLLEFLENLMK
ncbi:DEAD/DEAH box helicase [Methanobrevibacter curvatus]|uniref:ATP-dependent RNA helicase DbpA n=1 Tax=Methanobrevibacter curvatus TaxID=49547 RepID=A0A166B2X8_9EURY|nr:DEAD/DEAH box helicase [Methanobrevibacter curvatus]KZX12801.1 ATP-dependent RNA helicase DbpA [Methanobrevibacter curvatus]